MPFRVNLVNGTMVVESISEYLLTRSTLVMRKDGGFDSSNFLSWAEKVVEHVKPLTIGGRKVLITYDGYKAHMTLKVLKMFDNAGMM